MNIDRIPDMTEREIDRQLCVKQPLDVRAALQEQKLKYVRERAQGNALRTLLLTSPLDQVRNSLALMMAAMGNIKFPAELKAQGQGIWQELRSLEEKLQRSASGTATGERKPGAVSPDNSGAGRGPSPRPVPVSQRAEGGKKEKKP